MLELRELLANASPRKRRLLACACVRSMWWLAPHEIRQAVIDAEDGIVPDPAPEFGPQEISLEDGTKWKLYGDGEEIPDMNPPSPSAALPVDDTPDGPGYAELLAEFLTPCEIDPAWRTSTVLALAEAMYESRDFSAMPILADSLQDAGCCDESLLGRCRGPGPHFRGCATIDAILGYS